MDKRDELLVQVFGEHEFFGHQQVVAADDGIAAVSEVGYVELPADQLEATRTTWNDRTTGTTFLSGIVRPGLSAAMAGSFQLVMTPL